MSELNTIIVIISALSALASCSVLASYIFMRERPKLNDPSSMIIFLTLADLALSFTSMISIKGLVLEVYNMSF